MHKCKKFGNVLSSLFMNIICSKNSLSKTPEFQETGNIQGQTAVNIWMPNGKTRGIIPLVFLLIINNYCFHVMSLPFQCLGDLA